MTGYRDTVTAANESKKDSPSLMNQLVTIAIGNSITNTSRYDSAGANLGITSRSEIHRSNALCGGTVPMRFKIVTPVDGSPSGHCDKYSIYGYSSKRSDEMWADLATTLLAPMDAAGVVPDLVVLHSLFENDLMQVNGTTITSETIIATLEKFIRLTKNKWPGAIIHLVCPRPNNSYTDYGAYFAVRDYCLSLDDGYSIFVSRADVYEDKKKPGKVAGGSPAWSADGVHPSTRGAMALARVQALTLLRISSAFKALGKTVSTNFTMDGTATITSGTNQSGTMPTSVTYSAPGSNITLSTRVGSANQPGFQLDFNVQGQAGPASIDIGNANMSAADITGATQISVFATIKVLSGGANLRDIVMKPRIIDGGGTQAIGAAGTLGMSSTTADLEPDWIDGDIYMIKHPPIVAVSGALTGATCYIYPTVKAAGGTCSIEIVSWGVEVVS